MKEQDDRRTIQNSGDVVYDGNDDDSVDNDELDERQEFYGALDLVIKVHYICRRILVVFKCTWFDTDLKKK